MSSPNESELIAKAAANNTTFEVPVFHRIVERYRVVRTNHPRLLVLGISTHVTLATLWAADRSYSNVISWMEDCLKKKTQKPTPNQVAQFVGTEMLANGIFGICGGYVTLPMRLVSRSLVSFVKRNNPELWAKVVQEDPVQPNISDESLH